jgi:hypothetical protein
VRAVLPVIMIDIGMIITTTARITITTRTNLSDLPSLGHLQFRRPDARRRWCPNEGTPRCLSAFARKL